MLVPERAGFVHSHGALRARNHRRSGGHGVAARFRLGTQRADRCGGWSYEHQPRVFTGSREPGVFTQKAVARMNRLGAVFTGRVQNAVDPQIALRGRRRAHVLRFIRHANVQGSAVGVGIHGHAGDTHLAKGADHTHRNFTAIGNQNFSEHTGVLSG